MYYAMEGDLVEKKATNVVLKVDNIFYDIRISLRTFDMLKDKDRAKLYTYLVVKDDNLHLYGFANLMEKDFFLLLVQVNGISTATAQALLSALSVAEISNAILHEQAAVLQRVKGIGLKTAKRIILDLKDKVSKLELEPETESTNSSTYQAEALAALVKLGFDKKTATHTIENIVKKYGKGLSAEELIKYTLRNK